MNTLNKTRYLFFTLLLGTVLITACSKDDDPFNGEDNFITSFALVKGETVFNAAISGKTITVTVPELVALNNFVASVGLSENATIYPDPAAITQWDDEMQFVVTAYNGTQAVYKYTVERESIYNQNTVVLSTQAAVDAFGEQGITHIGGNLIIGSVTGDDTIRTLAPLYQLKEVAYSLIIYSNYSAENFTGLENLEKVGNLLQINSSPYINAVEFQNLQSAGSIEITVKDSVINTVNFPALNTVDKGVSINCGIKTMNFPNLQTVGGQLSLVGNLMAMLDVINFPRLRQTGDIAFTTLPNVTKLLLPELVKIANFSFTLSSLQFIYLPKLKEAAGTIRLSTSCNVNELSLPNLESAGGLYLSINTIEILEVPKLRNVSGQIYLSAVKLGGLDCFSALTHAEELYISNLSRLVKFEIPESVKTIGKLSIIFTSAEIPEEINVNNAEIGFLSIQSDGTTQLTGKTHFNGALSLAPYSNTIDIDCFAEVDSLIINQNVSYVSVRGLKKINKDYAHANGYMMKSFELPDLEETGGSFNLGFFSGYDSDVFTPFPKLKKVAGDFTVNGYSTAIKKIIYPELHTIGGDFLLYTGYNSGSTDYALAEFSFPSLKVISGKMSLIPHTNATYFNNNITDLNGFAALEQVREVEIVRHSALVSYEGLKNAFSTIASDKWTVEDNAFNPSYDELENGNWSKP